MISLMYDTNHSKYGKSSVIQHELGIFGADRSNGDLLKNFKVGCDEKNKTYLQNMQTLKCQQHSV
jgi:hypothetical protein